MKCSRVHDPLACINRLSASLDLLDRDHFRLTPVVLVPHDFDRPSVAQLLYGERLAPEDFSTVPGDVWDGRKSGPAAGPQRSTVQLVDAFGDLGSGGEDA